MKLSISSADASVRQRFWQASGPRAVVFDLDGTLIDSREDIAAACNHTLVALGRPPLPVDTIASYVGDGARMLLARAFSATPDGPEVERALAVFHPYYEAHPAARTTLMRGAREVLDALRDRPVALCTNKPRKTTLAVLEALGLAKRFSAIRAGGDGPLKPSPLPVQDVMRTLRVDAAHTWMVGDAEQDILAGRAAGCVTVGVRGGFQADERLTAAQPDLLVPSLHELVPLLRGASVA